jgi:hypothetical protein
MRSPSTAVVALATVATGAPATVAMGSPAAVASPSKRSMKHQWAAAAVVSGAGG